MKILWLDINSSYSHSSVALPAIHAQAMNKNEWSWSVIRGTINDNPGTLAAVLAQEKPDVIAATFWLFTHQMQIEVLTRAVQLLDNVKVICGGPEFLGNNEEFLRRNDFITAVIRGEGEISLPELLTCINDKTRWDSIEGLCWISETDSTYHDNGLARVKEFSLLKYPEESIFFNWDKPFVQLETTRGCFNDCAFCVSGGDRPVRYQSLDQVESRLDNILSHGIRDVRVLDRTFNYDTDRACRMLDLFSKYQGKLRFHLEIHPSLISQELKSKLPFLPEGLLHLEAGIQSLDEKVLGQCGRKGSLKSSLEGLNYLCSLSNLQTHADLIVGLPEYTLEMLCRDIEELVNIGVDELQVESLKVLPGTKMRSTAPIHGLRYSPLPPYEVLQTSAMTPSDIRIAMCISRMLDLYYNTTAWQSVIKNLILHNSDFIMNFTLYLKDKMILDSPISLERRGVILYEYCKLHHQEFLGEVSISWINSGFSLKKEAAGDITKVKDIHKLLSENSMKLSIKYGNADLTHRYYLLSVNKTHVLFGYDSKNHQPSPVFMAEVGLSDI